LLISAIAQTEVIAHLSHITSAKKELTTRINRIQGQLEGIKEAVQQDRDCAAVLQQVAACRGAINSFMAEIIEGEIKCHVLSPNAKANSSEARAADELVEVLRRYLK
jgi:DNA-binding FrmR family transcriptional regulator